MTGERSFRFFVVIAALAPFYPSAALAQQNDCLPGASQLQNEEPKMRGKQMPTQKGRLITPEDIEQFKREGHKPPTPLKEFPRLTPMTVEEIQAAKAHAEVERKKHLQGRPLELIGETYTQAQRDAAEALTRETPCPQTPVSPRPHKRPN